MNLTPKTEPSLVLHERVHLDMWEWYKKQLYSIVFTDFLLLPFAFQSGVYLEYFRSLGIEINIETHIALDLDKWYDAVIVKTDWGIYGMEDYGAALLAAFQSASELREGQLAATG